MEELEVLLLLALYYGAEIKSSYHFLGQILDRQ